MWKYDEKFTNTQGAYGCQINTRLGVRLIFLTNYIMNIVNKAIAETYYRHKRETEGSLQD